MAIRRTLAATRPDAFLPDLAMSLNNLGNRQSELGQREAALLSSREAVRLYLGFSRAFPERFLQSLLTATRGLMRDLENAGLPEDQEPLLLEVNALLQSQQGAG